jgi:hypothetical protein
MSSDLRLSRPREAWDLVMRVVPATPLRFRNCAWRFYQRLSPAQLHSRTLWPLALAGFQGPSHGCPGPAVLAADDSIPSKLIRETRARRGFAVFGAKSPDEGQAMFQAHHLRIDLAAIGLATPASTLFSSGWC